MAELANLIDSPSAVYLFQQETAFQEHHTQNSCNVTPPQSPIEKEYGSVTRVSRTFQMLKLPMEILDIVLDYCDAKTLGNLQLTCRSMRCVIRPTLWSEVHIEIHGHGKNRSPDCLAPPPIRYRRKPQWCIEITTGNLQDFIDYLQEDDNCTYLFWTRNLMIKSPVELDSAMLRDQANWLLANLPSKLTALDCLDIWGLTKDWYDSFSGFFDRFTSCSKSLHWIASANNDCVTINNLKAMTLHDEIMDNLNFAFELEELNFYSKEFQSASVLRDKLSSCSQLTRLALHIPGLMMANGGAVDWLSPYVTEYTQFFEHPIGEQHSDTPPPLVNQGVKFLRTTLPSGMLSQEFQFSVLERLSIYSGGSISVSDDLFEYCGSIKELVLEDIPLSFIIQTTKPLGRLDSLICRGGVFDGLHDSPKVLPKQLNYLIIKPNKKDTLNELTIRTANYIRNCTNLRVFIDVNYRFNHPEWKLVPFSSISDGYAYYMGDILYEHVL